MAEITTTTYTPTEIVALLDAPRVSVHGIAKAGQNLAKGLIVGVVTADGTIKPYNNANVDGTQTAYGILREAVDSLTKNIDTPCSVYVQGYFYEDKLAGLDAAAKTDLPARSLQNNVLKVG